VVGWRWSRFRNGREGPVRHGCRRHRCMRDCKTTFAHAFRSAVHPGGHRQDHSTSRHRLFSSTSRQGFFHNDKVDWIFDCVWLPSYRIQMTIPCTNILIRHTLLVFPGGSEPLRHPRGWRDMEIIDTPICCLTFLPIPSFPTSNDARLYLTQSERAFHQRWFCISTPSNFASASHDGVLFFCGRPGSIPPHASSRSDDSPNMIQGLRLTGLRFHQKRTSHIERQFPGGVRGDDGDLSGRFGSVPNLVSAGYHGQYRRRRRRAKNMGAAVPLFANLDTLSYWKRTDTVTELGFTGFLSSHPAEIP